MSEVRRVLVFGETGVGKTSMINILTDQNHLVNSSAVGCTFETTYSKPVHLGGHLYEFIDTVGLNEGSAGTVNSEKALKNLYDLIRNNKAGFNILVMVIEAGRITERMQQNYELFVSTLVIAQVPVILVVTHCENEKTLDSWPEDNLEYLKSYNMKFVTIVGSVWVIAQNSILESVYQQMRRESKEKVIEALSKHTLCEPKEISQSSVMELMRNIYNFLTQIFDLESWWDEFTTLVNKICDESHKEATTESDEKMSPSSPAS